MTRKGHDVGLMTPNPQAVSWCLCGQYLVGTPHECPDVPVPLTRPEVERLAYLIGRGL